MRLAILLVSALVSATPVLSQEVKFKGGWHEDTRYGFKVRPPEKFDQVPVSPEEKWVVAKYLSQKEYAPRGEYSFATHKPTMRVIVFLDEATKRKLASVKVADESESRPTLEIDGAEVPFKDYADYLRRTMSEGHYVAKDVEGRGAGGLVCRQLEINIDKGDWVKRRIMTWTFRGEDGEYAVEFDALADHFDKLAPSFRDSLKTFQFIKRAAAGPIGGTTGTAKKLDLLTSKGRKEWKELTPEERKRRRVQEETVRFEKSKKSIPDGWKVRETKNFFILSHTDDRYTDKIVEAAEACRKWLDEQFGDLSDEYVSRGFIRVFASYDEYRAYARDLTGFSPTRREILTYKDASFGRRSGFDSLFQGLGSAYLYEKDPGVFVASPTWFDVGFAGVLGGGNVKSSKFLPEPDEWETRMMAEALRTKKPPDAKELFAMSNEQFFAGYEINAGCATRLIRLFTTTRDKKLRGVLVDFLKATREVNDAAEEAASKERFAGSGLKEAETEEEEERLFKERQERNKKESGDLAKQTMDKAFGQWTEAQWKSLEKSYQSALK